MASWLEHTQGFCASLGPARVAPMGKHMDAKTRALCYFYRHPPRNSGVKPVSYRKIPKLLPARRPRALHRANHVYRLYGTTCARLSPVQASDVKEEVRVSIFLGCLF